MCLCPTKILNHQKPIYINWLPDAGNHLICNTLISVESVVLLPNSIANPIPYSKSMIPSRLLGHHIAKILFITQLFSYYYLQTQLVHGLIFSLAYFAPKHGRISLYLDLEQIHYVDLPTIPIQILLRREDKTGPFLSQEHLLYYEWECQWRIGDPARIPSPPVMASDTHLFQAFLSISSDSPS